MADTTKTVPGPPPRFPFATVLATLATLFLFAGLVVVAYNSPNYLGETKSEPKAEGGAQRVRVELHARVAHTRRVQREGLQLRVVRGRGDEHTAFEERLEHGHGERRSLVGVGPGADLIEEREVSSLGVRERRDDVAEVGRESGKRLRDRLLVADISEDAAHDR